MCVPIQLGLLLASLSIPNPTKHITCKCCDYAKVGTTVNRASSHRTVLSDEAETNLLPSELMATLVTESVCPMRQYASSPVSTFQILQVQRHVIHKEGSDRPVYLYENEYV